MVPPHLRFIGDLPIIASCSVTTLLLSLFTVMQHYHCSQTFHVFNILPPLIDCKPLPPTSRAGILSLIIMAVPYTITIGWLIILSIPGTALLLNQSPKTVGNGISSLSTLASHEEALETYEAWASWIDLICDKIWEAVGVASRKKVHEDAHADISLFYKQCPRSRSNASD